VAVIEDGKRRLGKANVKNRGILLAQVETEQGLLDCFVQRKIRTLPEKKMLSQVGTSLRRLAYTCCSPFW
jgi:hypothetical protein